ncbi:hypothetical protein BCR36DRAFT_579468 [Piromyces finnis]|uniref:Uncharacterized protein n=1 Tax=Piromyces finnis TaxID=1754191 RepID=A0A1Y1VN26_9FUNG|nr:hypothetical protein BCR36DRAFT_579468 [Piromyces finnis]|eukprot:ORX60022.1 hypothetical protein BCR36DRAFT_579468 [Piromyces finnis]
MVKADLHLYKYFIFIVNTFIVPVIQGFTIYTRVLSTNSLIELMEKGKKYIGNTI